ncbi:MAG: hypothetical protein AB1445_15700 [Bacillota bacterium]
MSVPEKSRISWKDGKAEELWEYVQTRTARGERITQALKDFADMNGISWLTARWKYYRVKQDRDTEDMPGEAPGQIPLRAVPNPETGDSLLEGLGGFLSRAARLGVDLDGFFAGLKCLAQHAGEGEELRARFSSLEASLRQRESEVAALKEQLGRVREQYETLNYLVHDWLNMQSVDRVTSMGDFGRRLRYQVDQFGTVIKLQS